MSMPLELPAIIRYTHKRCALTGSFCVIHAGAPGLGAGDPGGVFLFERSTGGYSNWGERARLSDPSGAVGD